VRFKEARLPGAWVIDPEPQRDERGLFARTFCAEEFYRHRLSPRVAQCSVSFNQLRGTLRGMHLQAPPHAETKLVRCTRGSIFDVIVDLRPDSRTYLEWFGIELSADNRTALYIPEGCAHGFQTLEDESEVHYQISVPYEPSAFRGYHFASPAFGIRWPLLPTVVSDRDKALDSLERSPSRQPE
jgi:dTDP-4-dehydrorhamnose 3,5-epimerase